ncbi:MAG TPA: Hsp20/alpha crystallin family protein [Gemmataceae bacterium]
MAHDAIRFVSLFLPASESSREEVWGPPADVYLTPGGWLVKLDLAGVRPEDVEVGLDGSTLVVRGERRDRCREEGCRCYRMEIAYSRFERRIELPADLTGASPTAEYREGMLLVRISEGKTA